MNPLELHEGVVAPLHEGPSGKQALVPRQIGNQRVEHDHAGRRGAQA